MRSKSEFRNSIVFTIAFAAAVALLVLLVVVATRAQNPVPPTAREAAASPAFASRLHPATPPALNQPQAARPRTGRASPLDGGIYDNGPINGTTDAWTLNFGYIVSDTFVAGGPTVTSFDLGVWEFPGDTLSSLQWSITSAPDGGTVYGSGTVSGSSLTDKFTSTNQYGYNIDKISATGLYVNVTSGSTYWFNVFNASVPSGDPVYWDENSGAGCHSSGCPSQAVESALGTIPSEAFDIGGSCGQRPRPSDCSEPEGKLQTIHDFTLQEVGAEGVPFGVSIDKAGDLYGTTTQGGDYGQGLVYQVSPRRQGWVFSPLYSFPGGSSGQYPWLPVIPGPDSAVYGVAQGPACGLVFSLRPAPTACLTSLCSWTENIVHQFTGDDGCYQYTFDGGNLVFDQAGELYGPAGSGGAYGFGAVFALTPSHGGWMGKVLYGFTGGSDGANPGSLLVGRDGNLYGTAGGGANGHGVVFQLVPSGGGWTEDVIYNFQGTQVDGAGPFNLLQDGAGNLYGLSSWNGGNGQFSIVFTLSLSNGKWVFTQVSLQGLNGGEGGIHNLATDPSGNLYGTADFDVQVGCGYKTSNYIFKLVPQGSGWQILYPVVFRDGVTFYTTGALALDAQGDLYGTTFRCGANGWGTVWEVSP
jgi:uncharacterized repeat protein (TIGR03803 family)